jgi:hypothetical protein
MKTYRWQHIVMSAAALAALLLIQNSCGWGSPDYSLTVILGEGISGYPGPGTYVYKEFDTVDYNYAAVEGAVRPQIYLNAYRRTTLTGILTIYTNTEMRIDQTDMRDRWIVTAEEDDEETLQWVIECTGADRRSGSFTDNRGYNGTWTVEGTDDLTLTYTDWQDFVFRGTLLTLAGDWTGDGRTGTFSIGPLGL